MSHITGKVYDLTQENMNKLIAEVERLTDHNKMLNFELRALQGFHTQDHAKLVEAESTILKLRTALNDLLNEISEARFNDDRFTYSEHQITKGAIEIARDALKTPGENTNQFKVKADETAPPGEAHFVLDGKVVGKIINTGEKEV